MAEQQPSYNSKRLIAVAIVAVIGLIGVSIFLHPKEISVRESDDIEDSKQQSDEHQDEPAPSQGDAVGGDEKKYSYTVVAGDSYSLLARQVVAAVAGTELSDAQRVAAETKLTQDAGAPHLEIGQIIEFDEAKVLAVIDWASALDKSDQAAWQPYADLVIFPEIK